MMLFLPIHTKSISIEASINSFGEEVYFKRRSYCSSDGSSLNKQKGTLTKELLNGSMTLHLKKFYGYLSFSKSSIIKELCQAIKTRNLKLTILVDEKNRDEEKKIKKVLKLKKCVDKTREAQYPCYPYRWSSWGRS